MATDYPALIKKHGSITRAAKMLGIARSTFRDRMRGSKSMAQIRAESYVPTPNKDLHKQIEALETERDLLATQLAAARGVVVKEPLRIGTPHKRNKEDVVRVIIPDSHGDHISRPAAAAFIGDLKAINPDEIVMLGDHLDCGGFLAQHHTMGYVAETETTYEADVMATNEFLDQIQKAAPKARIKYLLGNHEGRVEKWCVTQALRNKRDAQFLLSVFGPKAVLNAKGRGIEMYDSSGRYDGLPVPGTIKLGECCFTHGIGCGLHATHSHAARFGISVVHGHTHRAQSSIIRTVGGGVIGAWSPGCLAQLQPLYMATSPTDWSHGYAVQFVAKSGKFLHLQIPIIDGTSMFLAATKLH